MGGEAAVFGTQSFGLIRRQYQVPWHAWGDPNVFTVCCSGVTLPWFEGHFNLSVNSFIYFSLWKCRFTHVFVQAITSVLRQLGSHEHGVIVTA